MDAASIACSKCKTLLSPDLFSPGVPTHCSSCGTKLTVFLFPALSHPTLVTQAPESILTDSEAGCFFHPAKKAVVACEGCGRFLCGLCDLEWDGKHLCMSCLEAGKKKGKIKTLDSGRVLYDNIALSVAILPVLFVWCLTWATAPMAIFICLRYWKAPSSIIPRSKIRFIIAMLFALTEIGCWIWGIAEIVHKSQE